MLSSLDTAPGRLEASERSVSDNILEPFSRHDPDPDQVHHDKFSCGELVTEDCDMARRFTGHKVTPARMKRIHDTIKEGKC